MTPFEWASVLLAGVIAVVAPVLALLVRLTVRWTRTEDSLAGLVEDVRQLQIANDRRLRWLEENLWNRGGQRRNG